MAARSYLYVPGHRPDRFAKAESSGADAAIFDLEDAVPSALKRDARDAVLDWISSVGGAGVERWVRINAGEHGMQDALAIAQSGACCGLVVPKSTPDVLRSIAKVAPDYDLLPLVESAATLRDLDGLMSQDNVCMAAMGEVDLAADLGVGVDAADSVWWSIRTLVLVASVAAGRGQPIGPVDTRLDDVESLRITTQQLRDGGFGGRQAIHPSQVSIINDVFTPSNAEIIAARRLVELGEIAGGGVCVDDDGRMIDEATLKSARQLLASGHFGRHD